MDVVPKSLGGVKYPPPPLGNDKKFLLGITRNHQESPNPGTKLFGANLNCSDVQSSSQRAKGRVKFDIQV